MSLDTKPIYDAIHAHLQEDDPVVFHNSEVPDEESLPTNNGGFVKPYGTIYFTQPVRAAVGRGIVSSRRDTNRAGCTVTIASHRPQDGQLIADRVKDKLTGFVPPDATELILEGGASANNGTGTSKPTMFYQYLTFSFYCNMIVG